MRTAQHIKNSLLGLKDSSAVFTQFFQFVQKFFMGSARLAGSVRLGCLLGTQAVFQRVNKVAGLIDGWNILARLGYRCGQGAQRKQQVLIEQRKAACGKNERKYNRST